MSAPIDGNSSDFDNSDEDLASLLADDDDDIFTKKTLKASPSKKPLDSTISGSKSQVVAGSQLDKTTKSPGSLNKNAFDSSKQSPSESASKEFPQDDDDALNDFLSESSLPSFLGDSKKTSKKTTKLFNPEKESSDAVESKPSKPNSSKNGANKKRSEKSKEEDDIFPSPDTEDKAPISPRKQSGSFFDDFLKTLSPKKSAKELPDDESKGDDTDDDDILKSLESDIKGPTARKKSGLMFDEFLKTSSPKQSPKKSSAFSLKPESVTENSGKSTFEKSQPADIKSSNISVARKPSTEDRRKHLQKQVSFKDLPDDTFGETSPNVSPTKNPSRASERAKETLLAPTKPSAPARRSERVASLNKDDTDWLNFFKESPKKSAKPKEQSESERTSTEVHSSAKDSKLSADRRRSSSAEWLGLSNAEAKVNETGTLEKEMAIEDPDWRGKGDSSRTRPRTTPGRSRQQTDFDLSWLGNSKNESSAKSNKASSVEYHPESVETDIGKVLGTGSVDGMARNQSPARKNGTLHSQQDLEQNGHSGSIASIVHRTRSEGHDTKTGELSDALSGYVDVQDSNLSRTAASNAHAVQSLISNHNLEKDQLVKSAETLKVMYEERIKYMETMHKDQVRSIEESSKSIEDKLKSEIEAKSLVSEKKLVSLEDEKKAVEKELKNKMAELEKQHSDDIKKLKELHNQSIQLMKEDHENALLRLKRLKEQEIEAVLSTQTQTKSLQQLTDQLDARAVELAALQLKVEEKSNATLREKQLLLDSKERELKSLQNRLQKQLDDGDEERTRLQQLVLRLESRLQKYAAEGEEDRWEVQQMKAKLSVQQKHLDEEYKFQLQQLEREKEKLRLSQDSLLHEQKTVLLQLAQDRQILMQEKAEMDLLAKRVKEGEVKINMKKLKEDTFSERQRQFLQQEEGRLHFERNNLKQESELLEREKDFIQKELQLLREERSKVNDATYKLKRKEHELDVLSASTAEEKERGHVELTAALKVRTEQQSRLQQISQKMQALMEKEQQVLEEKEKLSEQRLELESKKNSLVCNKCKLSLGFPVNAPPQQSVSSTALNNINPIQVMTSPLNSISNQLLPSRSDPSLIVWYVTAQKDREFLQEELSFLKTLKDSSKNFK